MSILVVGGAGYIGSLMVKRLAEAGHAPVVLDDLSTGIRAAVPASVPFYEGDLGDAGLLKDILHKERTEVVMHFAAKISVGESVQRPDLYYRNNVAKVLGLLDAMREHGCLNFIFSSTAAVYGSPERLPVDESHPLAPINPYGASKRMVETILEGYEGAFGFKSIVLRYFNAAGAAVDGSIGESQKVKQNLIPIILDNLEHDRVTTVFGNDWETRDGTCIRDYVHVEDIVSAHLKALDYLVSEGKSDLFNVGTNSGATVREVIAAVERATGRKVKTADGPRRPGDPGALLASNDKARDLLGWEPSLSGLDSIVTTASRWHFNRHY